MLMGIFTMLMLVIPMVVLMMMFIVLVLVLVLVGMGLLFRFVILVVRVDRSPMDAELHSFDVLPLVPLEVHVEIPDLHFGQLPLESGRLDPEIAQCTHGHIAADARETIKKENAHDGKRSRSIGRDSAEEPFRSKHKMATAFSRPAK